jgi:hypothetical protein
MCFQDGLFVEYGWLPFEHLKIEKKKNIGNYYLG